MYSVYHTSIKLPLFLGHVVQRRYRRTVFTTTVAFPLARALPTPLPLLGDALRTRARRPLRNTPVGYGTLDTILMAAISVRNWNRPFLSSATSPAGSVL